MGDVIKQNLLNVVQLYHANDPQRCCQEATRLEQAFKVLQQEGISLPSVKASTQSAAATDTGTHPQHLYKLLHALQKTQPAGPAHPLSPPADAQASPTSPTSCSNHSSCCSSSCSPHNHHHSSPNSTTCAQCRSIMQLHWLPASPKHPNFKRCEALHTVRRWLVLSHSPKPAAKHGLQKLLADDSMQQALQDVLPFVSLDDVVAGIGAPATLLSLLPAAVRGWLLADVAAGLLLGNSGRHIPNTPQHCAALSAMLTSLSAPAPSDYMASSTTAANPWQSLLQQRQQQRCFMDSLQTWDAYKQHCGDTVAAARSCNVMSSPPVSAAAPEGAHCSSESSRAAGGQHCQQHSSPAASLLALLQSHLSFSSGSSNGRMAATGVLLPTHVASALAADISVADHSSSGGNGGGSYHALHACLSRMAVAALQDLEQSGLRAGVSQSLVYKQQLCLQLHIHQMLLPLHQLLQQPSPPPYFTSPPHSRPQQEEQQQYAGAAGNSLYPEILQVLLSRVQGFMSTLQEARAAQQQEVLAGVQQQLQVLSAAAAAADDDDDDDDDDFDNGNDASSMFVDSPHSSLTDGIDSKLSAAPATAAPPPPALAHLMSTPDLVDMVGAGSFEVLLQLSQQHTPRPSYMNNLFTVKLLEATPEGSPLLDFTGTQHLVKPGQLLKYWRARAAASDAAAEAAHLAGTELPDSDSSNAAHRSSSLQQVCELLQCESGLDDDEVLDYVFSSAAILEFVQLLDRSSAVRLGKVPLSLTPLLVRSNPGSGSLSSMEVLPGFSYQHKPSFLKEPQLAVLQDFPAAIVPECGSLGLVAEFQVVGLLVKAALQQLPDLQQQQHEHPKASSSSNSSTVAVSGDGPQLQQHELLPVLRARLLKFQQIWKALGGISDIIAHQQQQKDDGSSACFCSQQQERLVLEQLVAAAVPGCDSTNLAQHLLAVYRTYALLRDHLAALHPEQSSSSSIAYETSDALLGNVPAAAPATRTLAALFSRQIVQVIQDAVPERSKQQLQPVLEEYIADWSLAGIKNRKRCCSYITALLDPLETILCRMLCRVLYDAATADQTALQLNEAATALQSTQQMLLAVAGSSMTNRQWQCMQQDVEERLVEPSATYDALTQTVHELKVKQPALRDHLESLRCLADTAVPLLLDMHYTVLPHVLLQLPSEQQQQQSSMQQLEQHASKLLSRLSMLRCTLGIISTTFLGPSAAADAWEAAHAAETAVAHAEADVAAAEAAAGSGPRGFSRDQVLRILQHRSSYARNIHIALTAEQQLLREVLPALKGAALGFLGALGMSAVPGSSSSNSNTLSADPMVDLYKHVVSAVHPQHAAASSALATGPAGNKSETAELATRIAEAAAARSQQLLQLGKVTTGQELHNLLQVLAHVTGQSGSSSSNAVFARRRFQELWVLSDLQKDASNNQQPGTASSSTGITSTSAAAGVWQLTADPSSTSTCLHHACWQMLLTCKPSLARALHISSLPRKLRTYELYEQAVLGWPPAQRKQQDQGQQELQWHLMEQLTETLKRFARKGPPPASGDWSWAEWRLLMAALQHDTLGLQDATFRSLTHLMRCDCCGPKAPATLQQQYARAVQISLCKSGNPGGLVRRLLLLEAIRHPDQASLLHPKLLPAWREQQAMELSKVVVPQGFQSTTGTDSSCGKAVGSAAGRADLAASLASCYNGLQHCNGASSDVSPDIARRSAGRSRSCSRLSTFVGSWHPQLLPAVLKPAGQTADAQMCEYSVVCLNALCCWVLCWHCCMEEKGGRYDCAATRAAAAEAASDLVGPDTLQHIWLPSWRLALPPAASNDVSESSIWWQSWAASSSSAPSRSNQTWSQLLSQQPAGSASDTFSSSDTGVMLSSSQQLCDHCRKPAAICRRAKDQYLCSTPYYCPGCGIAVYCSRSCADKDKEYHKPWGQQCRLLACASAKGAAEWDWAESTAAMASSARGSSRSLVAASGPAGLCS